MPYLDYATPNFLTQEMAGIEELLGGTDLAVELDADRCRATTPSTGRRSPSQLNDLSSPASGGGGGQQHRVVT